MVRRVLNAVESDGNVRDGFSRQPWDCCAANLLNLVWNAAEHSLQQAAVRLENLRPLLVSALKNDLREHFVAQVRHLLASSNAKSRCAVKALPASSRSAETLLRTLA